LFKNAMDLLLNNLVAVFLVIALGCVASQSGFIKDNAWQGFETVTYHILIPAVVIHTLAFARIGDAPIVAVAAALVTGILATTALTLAARKPLAARGVDGPAFTSLFQGAVRWNTFVALALASYQFGTEGTALMAIAIAAMIPLVNVISVLILNRYARGAAFDLRQTALTLIRNPFIWSCAVGLAMHPFSGVVPTSVSSAIDIVGRAALAAGLLVVGAGLDLKRLARPRLPHFLSIGLKLLILPAIVFVAATLLGLSGTPLMVTMIAATVPTASASYILARQMGGDAPLMAEILTLQTILALLTMPLILLMIGM
jgi:malonate transporter and related proteins